MMKARGLVDRITAFTAVTLVAGNLAGAKERLVL
jgi:hypothetical protein